MVELRLNRAHRITLCGGTQPRQGARVAFLGDCFRRRRATARPTEVAHRNDPQRVPARRGHQHRVRRHGDGGSRELARGKPAVERQERLDIDVGVLRVRASAGSTKLCAPRERQ